MKRVLMIAYHFPPLTGSSGIQRTLRFARYLPEFGWEPIVLTAHPRAYQQCSDDQVGDVPNGVKVIRALAWDTSRHFSIAGRYPAFLARPDRWMSWWLGGVPAGLSAIRRYRPRVIWSTYPIATAHRIGASLAGRSGLPWVADFRDPMVQEAYPRDPATRESFRRIESRAISGARLSTFTTPGAVRDYAERYPEQSDRLRLLENGYDEETFRDAEGGDPLNPGRVTLVHSGVVYPKERDPRQLFEALALLRESRPDLLARLVIRFRAPVHVDLLEKLASQHDVKSSIEILPQIGYREALAEMLRANGLLILQAANCNAQVPAKIYEYLRARRPILALTDPSGDTARVARSAGIESIAPLDSAPAIRDLLVRIAEGDERGMLPSDAAVSNASRRSRTGVLAELLDSLRDS